MLKSIKARIDKLHSIVVATALSLLASIPAFAVDQLQLPSLADAVPNLLQPFTSIPKTFSVGGTTQAPYQVVDASSFQTISSQVYQSGNNSAFLSFDNARTWMGPTVSTNLNQVLTVPVSTVSAKSYGTKLYLTLGAEYLSSSFSNELLLRVLVRRQNPNSASGFHDDEINLFGGTHIVNRSNETGSLFQDPIVGYFKKWTTGQVSYYTLFLPLDQAYFNWPIQEVQLIYNNPFPTTSIQKPNIHICGMNIETNIQIQPFLSFSQLDPLWRLSSINNTSEYMKNKGCIITSAAMAMRAIGLQKGPDGSDITPGTLVTWLNSHSGFSGKSSSLYWPALTTFANAAQAAGYNAGNSMKLTEYRQDRVPNLSADQKRNSVEAAMASKYPVMLRVASGYQTADVDKNRNAHTVLSYGLVPDYTSSVSGTYQINDPGVSAPAPNLWRRTVGNSSWKGKWIYGVVAKPVNGPVVLPNVVNLVLHSPGKIYAEGAGSGYKIGYLDGVHFTNTFPNATYEILDPDEDFEPGDDNTPFPASAEKLQVVRIFNRPSETLNLKVVGTGTGPYSLDIDEKAWKNGNQELILSDVKSGTLTPTTVVNTTLPPHGIAIPSGVDPDWIPASTNSDPLPAGQNLNNGPKITWQAQEDVLCSWGPCGNYVTRQSGEGDIAAHQIVVSPAPNQHARLYVRVESRSGCALLDIEGSLRNSATGWTRDWDFGVTASSTDEYWGFTLGDRGMWAGTLKVSDACGNQSVLKAAMDVGSYISISSQPVSKTVSQSGQASFSVSATAVPSPSYQWYKDGQILTGQTTNSYSIPSASLEHFGHYYCHIKQLSGPDIMSEVISSSAQLDVIPSSAPALTPGSPVFVRGGICRIAGSYFGYNPSAVKAVFNGIKLFAVRANNDTMEFKVPGNTPLGSATLQVEVYGIMSTNTLTGKVIPNLAPILQLLQ